MRMDTNTNGHRQWFYFSIKNVLPGVIKLNVYRFRKKFSLFQRGMKPYVRSIKAKENWKAGGSKIYYRCEKQLTEYGVAKQKQSYFLTFQYKFQYPQDQVFFSSGLPYTVTFLRSRLDTFCSTSYSNDVSFKVSSLGKSMCGQNLPLLTIQCCSGRSNKNYIVINARTHAGETSCSWVLDGFLQRVSQSQQIQQWIQRLNISLKIIPMLNIDGVFMGNYRTGIMGEDFNRKFATGRKQIFPEIFALKKVVSQCRKNGKLYMFLDLHGHSILKNSFMYGPIESLFQNNPFRTLPFTLWHSSKYFRLSSCKFKFEKDLTETARVYFQIRDSLLTYTCEISLGLYFQNGKTIQFMQADYKAFGSSMADSLPQILTKQKLINYEAKKQENSKTIQISNNTTTQERQQYKGKKTKEDTSSVKKQQGQCLQKIKKARIQITEQFGGKLSTKQRASRQKQSKLEKLDKKKIDKSSRTEKQIPSEEAETRNKKHSIGNDARNTTRIDFNTFSNKNKSTFILNNVIKPIKFENKMKKDEVQEQSLSHGVFSKGNMEKKMGKNKEELSQKNKKGPNSLKKDPFQLQEEEKSLVRHIDSKKSPQQVQFKIRRKSDILKVLPQSLRKKVLQIGGDKILNKTGKYFLGKSDEEEQPFVFQRSLTYDPAYLQPAGSEINTEPNELQIINQKFSEEYESMNDSDGSSSDLCDKQKQYLLECIRNNRKLHTYNDENQSQGQSEEQLQQNSHNLQANFNGFRQIRFKSIQPIIKAQSSGYANPRLTKREPHKFRDLTHKSLCRNYFDEDSNNLIAPPSIAQRKQLNERIQRKTQREPYFLIQIKSKNN